MNANYVYVLFVCHTSPKFTLSWLSSSSRRACRFKFGEMFCESSMVVAGEDSSCEKLLTSPSLPTRGECGQHTAWSSVPTKTFERSHNIYAFFSPRRECESSPGLHPLLLLLSGHVEIDPGLNFTCSVCGKDYARSHGAVALPYKNLLRSHEHAKTHARLALLGLPPCSPNNLH